MDDSSEISTEAAKALALREFESCLSAKDTLLREHSDAYKWLMVSLLAINAGGLLKVADFASIGSIKSFAAGTAFLIGILAALAIAWLGQISARKMMQPLAELIAFWSIASVSGHLDEAQFKALGTKVQLATNGALRNRWVSWISVLAICFGVVTIASGPVQGTVEQGKKSPSQLPQGKINVVPSP